MQVDGWIPIDEGRTILDLLDLWARASIDQHVKETEQERDRAARARQFSKLSASDFSARFPMSFAIRSSRFSSAFNVSETANLPPHQLRALEMIERQTRHQSFLIEDLLDLHRNQIGKIELHRSLVDLRDCVRHAAETNQSEVQLKSLDVRLDLPAEPVLRIRRP